MAKDPWSVVSQESVEAPDGWSVVSTEPAQPARRAVNLGEEPPPSGMSGEFAGFADVFAPPQPRQESVLQGRPMREPAIARDKLLDPSFVDAIRQNVEQMDPAQRQATLAQMARRTDVYGRAAKVLGEHYREVEAAKASPTSTVLARPRVEEQPTFLGQMARGARGALEYGLPSMGIQLGLQGSASAMVARQGQLALMDRIDQGEFKTLEDLKNDPQYQTLREEGDIGLVNSYFSNRGKTEINSRLRNRTQQEITKLVGDTAGHIRTLNQYARENKEKYGPSVEKFTDLDWSDPRVVSDFKNWLGYNMGAGAVQMAPIMLAAITTKQPGLLATSASMGVSEAVGTRLKFIQDQVKNLPADQRGAAIAKYIADSGDTNLITGLVSGSFDLLLGPAAKAAKAGLPQEIGKLVAVKKAVKELPSDIGGEAVTGALQQATQIAAAKKLQEEGRAVTLENIKDIIDSAAAEATGAPFGTAINVAMAAATAPSAPQARIPQPQVPPAPEVPPSRAPRARVEPRLEPGALPVPTEERREPTGGFEVVRQEPSAPEDMVVPGMPTGEELEEPAAAPAALPPAPPPTQAAAALPETPTVPPVTKPKAFEPAAPQHEAPGLPINEVPLSDLRLSKDVPQFKLGATTEGVVEPLGGKFERTGVAPIQVWRRLDGSLEVISGRHRFDLAKRSGEKTIPAQIHDEAQGFGRVQAATLDAELNIRDGQGKVKDYVNFFKESGIDRQAAESKGLLARSTGKRSFTIANQGSDELVAAVRADQIGDEAAYYVALNAPKDSRLQGVGIKAIMDGKSMNTAVNMMQAVKALAAENDTTTDLFGYDDSALREAEEMAKIAAKNQRSIQARLSAITGASKNPELARQEGIDIRDPEAVQKRIGELRQMKAAWDNWNTSPELIAQIREERGQPAPTLKPIEPAITAQTEEDLRQKAEREAEAERRQREEKAEAERKAKADAERDEFVLTGSDRAADEAAARGQADIFGAPAEEAPPAAAPKAANPIKVLEQSGFVRVPNGDPKQYVDKGGQPYLTMERGPVRIALQPSELLFVDKNAVIKGMDEDAFTLAALLVEPDARGQGLARKALQDVIKATDSFDKDLYLEPAPLDDQPMSREQLIKFYKSVGFEFQPNSNNKVMVRKAGERKEAAPAAPAKLDPIKVIDKYFAKLKEQTAKESYETTDDKLVKTQTYELDETISRAEFDALVGEANVTPQKRGNKYAITLVDTENASSILTFNARGLTPTQQQVEVFMQLQTSEVVTPEAAAPGELPDENDPGFRGASDEEVKDVAGAFKSSKKSQDEEKTTKVFDPPAKNEVVRIEDRVRVFVKDQGYMTVAEAKKRIQSWKDNADKQGKSGDNSDKIVLSLFDLTGQWSKPWEDAGYQVFRFDIQEDPEFGDVSKFSVEFFNEVYGSFEGRDIYAILAACPCTDFASSGAKHFAAKDASGQTFESVELVRQTLATVEYFKPAVWAIENPVGRIEKLTGLPPWRMSFNPNHFGDPYTKKTLLWGRFNADLPVAPVEATEGSKMHRLYGGKSEETKNARSVTPEGFAYAFFQANNAIDNPVMAITNKYDMMDPAVLRKALDAGMTEQEISSAVDDSYYDGDYKAANSKLNAAIEAKKPKGAAVMGQRMVNAADRFRKAAMSQFKLTEEQADAAMGKLLKEKILILDSVTGQFELKDGRFWDREVLLKAAGEKPAEKPAEKPETTKEDKDNAEVHAKELGGEVVWQKGPFALVRGYSILTGDPVYVATMGSSRARVDIEEFTGAQIPEDAKQEMIAAKKAAEKEAEAKHKKKPFIKFKDGVAVSDGISPEIEGIIRGWKDILKLDVPIYVGTIEDARINKNNYTGPHRRIGSGTLDEGERGSARRMSDGSFYILFKGTTSPTLMLETLAHEMGHIHEKLVFENATPEEKQALRDAHQKWLTTQKDKTAQELVNALRARATQRKTKVPEGMTAEQLTSYWKSFGEWYADQVSRWAVSGVVPVGVVEKFFKRLGNQLRRFYQILKNARYLPDETFAQYIEKVTSRPANLAPSTQDVADRMVEGFEPIKKFDVLQNIEPKDKGEQSGFAFDVNATDQIAKNNPTVAQNLARANQLPGAKKKLPPGRSPELAAAAQQVQAGLMTAKEYDELVNRYRPIPVYFAPLKPATSQEVYNALDVAKREKINPDIKEGYPVGLRLDIPAFNRHGVYVVSIHEKRTPSAPGKVIGYGSVARIKDVTFGAGNQREALKIATGEAKNAIQTMEGKYVPITPEQAYEMADNAILSGDWVQMGIDPTRHAYFFDRRTTLPVVAAQEVIQIGNTILARGVTFGKKEDFLYNIASEPSLAKQEGELEFGNTRKQQIERYAAINRKKATIEAKVAKGEVSIDLQRQLNRLRKESAALQAAIKATAPRRDSAERFMARALQEYDDGNISAEVLAVVQQVYQQYPEILDGLLLSVRKGEGSNAVGTFAAIARIVTLFKGTSGVDDPSTIRHELAHSLEQMMTSDQANAVVQAWFKALSRAIKQNPDEVHQRYFQAVMDFIENPTMRTFEKAQKLLPSYEMYQFINPSEYWAVNAEKLLNAQLGSAWDKFKKALNKIFQAIKDIFGFNNTYAVHKIFDQVMNGKRERMTNDVLVSLVTSVDGDYVTLNNIQDEKELMEKYSRPKTPMLDQTPTKTFITRQFKNGKEFFSDAAKNPKEAMVGSGTAVIDGLIYLRNKNVWYGSGLEARDFDKYNGELRTSEGMATASVALDNAIRSGNIGVEVIFQGGIAYDKDKNNFVAVKRKLGMKGVYEAEAAIKARLGDQLGTDIVQGYLEAKRSISIMDELYEREAALEDAKQNLEAMRALKRAPEEIAQAQALVKDLESDVDAINKAVSSVNMSEEEMGEFAALDQKHPELRDLMENWNAINQNLLKFWRQVGLLSAGRYEKLSAIKDYVPWYRIMNDEEDIHSPIQSTTRSMANIGREKLFKRGKPISVVDFRAKAGQQDFKIQPSSVVKVKVNGQAVDPDKVSVTSSGEVRIDMPLEENDLVVFETNREIENIIDNMTRNVMRMTMNGIRQFAANRIVLEYASRNENGKIMVFPSVDKDKGRFNWIVNGKKVVVEIQDPLVAASIYGMENLNLQMWAPLAAVANFTRRTITLSGVFQIKQVFKDAPTAALVTGVKNPLALIGGVYKGFITSLTNTDPVVDILKAAGIGGYMSPARTPEAEIKRRLGIMNRNVFDFVIKGLDHIGDASDMAQRVATYKRVMAETGDETQALYQAANVINFLHHGSAGYAQAIVKTVPFMGAYANATDVLVRALVGGGLKGMSRKKALARLGITMAILSSLTLLYAMLAGGDPEYDELDDQTKLRNIIIPGTKIMLPMNTSAAYFFKAIPELIYNKVTREGTENEMDRKRLRKALADAARDMLLGPEPIPAGVKPVLEVAINHSFFTGRPVIPEGMKDLEAAEQYTAATSELGKRISAMLEIPGTDGKRVISPIEADHLIRGIFGTAGAMGQWISNSIGAMAETRPAPTARETPITGSFLRPEIPRGREDLFYDFKESVDKKYATYMKMIEREDDQAAEAYLEKHGDLVAMKEYITETENELKEINAEIRRIGTTRSKDMSPQERRREMDDYQRLKIEILEPVKEMRREAFGAGFVAK